MLLKLNLTCHAGGTFPTLYQITFLGTCMKMCVPCRNHPACLSTNLREPRCGQGKKLPLPSWLFSYLGVIINSSDVVDCFFPKKWNTYDPSSCSLGYYRIYDLPSSLTLVTHSLGMAEQGCLPAILSCSLYI